MLTVNDPEHSTSSVEGQVFGGISFTVGESHGFVLNVMGYYGLQPYGLTGANIPTCQIWGPNGYYGSYGGEGSMDLGTLATGTYTLFVCAYPDTSPGLVVVSVTAN